MKPIRETPAPKGRVDRALEIAAIVAVLVLPVLAALAHASFVDDGARDATMLRALALGWVGGASLDAWIAAPFAVLPFGTLVFRLALPSALAAGCAGLALFAIARRLGALATHDATPRMTLAVATIGSLAATLATPWQLEAGAPLGRTIGAACVLAAAAWATRPGALAKLRAEPERALPFAVTAAAFVAFALLRRARSAVRFDVDPVPVAAHAFDRARAIELVVHHAGAVTCLLALAGVALALRARSSRAIAAALAPCAIAALVSVGYGNALSPERFDASALVATALVQCFAALGIAALVRWVASLRVPLASASAAMVALLAGAFPAIAFDESSLAVEGRAALERIDWATQATGTLPPGTLVVGEDPRAMERIMAASLVGEVPSPLAFVPLYDVGGHMVRRELVRTPAIVPLVRDITLSGFPTELALSNLAGERSLAMIYSPRWDRALARHLVPAGALDRFEPEPRGIADRRAGMDESETALRPLAAALHDATARALAASTNALLAWRVEALGAIHDREIAPRALDAMRAFDANDPQIAALEARVLPKSSREHHDVARR